MDIDKNMTITEKNLPYPSVINLAMKDHENNLQLVFTSIHAVQKPWRSTY